MKDSSIEPGLLPAFRWLVSVQLVMLLASLLALPFIHSNPQKAMLAVGANIIELVFLLFYLKWPPIQRRLGRIFLPIPLTIITLAPILFQYYSWQRYSITGDLTTQIPIWQLVPILMIPLVLVSWQYKFPGAVFFTGLLTLLDAVLVLLNMQYATISPTLSLYAIFGILFSRAILFLVVGALIAQIMRSQRRQRQELSEANIRLLNYASTLEQLSVSRERNRLARELHDTLAHTLSATSVQLEAVRVLWDSDPGQARLLLEHTLAGTREGLTETRRALQALRASPLEDLGLSLAIRSLAQAAADRAGFVLDVDLPETLNDLPYVTALTIYRTTQEALENVIRHAGAHRVSVRLACQNGRAVLEVKDDGLGFDPENVDETARFGLRGLQERAAVSGAQLDVSSHPGQGTALVLTMENAYDTRAHL
jgi:signal transduction histidine kinase